METKQIISWLRDKADRAHDLSWTRMMHTAADRLKELDREQRTGHWINMGEGAARWVECSYCHVCGSPQWKVCPVCETRMVNDGV